MISRSECTNYPLKMGSKRAQTLLDSLGIDFDGERSHSEILFKFKVRDLKAKSNPVREHVECTHSSLKRYVKSSSRTFT